MSDPIIQVENLSKIYRIGSREKVNRTFREAVVDMFSTPIRNFRRLHKLNKFNISQINQSNPLDNPDSDIIWALKDISFEVRPGEVIGIIGRNGAGKSTLLKILSRITEPTSGEIRLYGRISSLLEVGTGFHPELTGRENIYLNGSILGMRKSEIDGKFEEIVAFSEIEKFLDTPVKWYSSGMYVRLAFAVAAHLEPEILLVDEILAVGDAAFQRKCLGKMGDVAREGQTVLFVSHNMAAIETLCKRAIVLHESQKIEDGPVQKAIDTYTDLGKDSASTDLRNAKNRKGSGIIRFAECFAGTEEGVNNPVPSGKDCILTITFQSHDPTITNVAFGAAFYCKGAHISSMSTLFHNIRYENLPMEGTLYCRIPRLPFAPGFYEYSLVCRANKEVIDYIEVAGTLQVTPGNFFNNKFVVPESQPGALVDHTWTLKR